MGRVLPLLCVCVSILKVASADVVCYEYLTISGGKQDKGARLLTNYIPKDNTVIRARYSSSGNGTASQYLFCSRLKENAGNFSFLPDSGGKFRFDYGSAQCASDVSFTVGRYYDVEAGKGVSDVVDFSTSERVKLETGEQFFNSQYKLALFQSYGDGATYSEWNNSFKGRFCYLLIYEIEGEKEVLKHYFVPCKEDGVVKLCDLADVNKVRYELVSDSDVTVAVGGPVIIYPDLITGYQSQAYDKGPVQLPIVSPEGTIGWTFDEMTNFSKQATLTGSGYIAPGDHYTDPVVGIRKVPAILAGVGAGAGTGYAVSLTNTASLSGGSFNWRAGMAYLAEPTHVVLDSFTVHNVKDDCASFYDVVHTPGVVLDGGITFEGGLKTWFVGPEGGTSVAPTNVARLVVKNATIINNTVSKSSTNPMESALALGGTSWGEQPSVLEVHDGAVVSNKLLIGGVGGSAGVGYGCGLVRQTGGKVFSLGLCSGTAVTYCPGVGIGNSSGRVHGHYDLTGGDFTAFGSFAIGAYGIGTWRQTGGTAVFTAYPGSTEKKFTIAAANGGWGAVDLSCGTMSFDGNLETLSGASSSDPGRMQIAVDGSDSGFLVNGYIRSSVNGGGNKAAFAVRNGGRIKAGGIYKAKEWETSRLHMSFDNGTYECSSSYCRMFANYNDNAWSRADAVIVRQGGMRVDTGNVKTKSLNITVPLCPPFGGGVESVPLDVPLSGAGCILPPFVNIVGDGAGAIAMPVWDADSSTVSGFRIVDPGVGYTVATAIVYKTKTTKLATIECVVSEAPNRGRTGSFTKAGIGEIQLASTNKWGGATVLKGGVLKCTCDWAIPDGSEVVLSGGTLDFNGMTGNVSRIVYGSGGGSIKNADRVILPASWDMAISTAEIAAQMPITFIGNVNLSDKSLAISGGSDVLDEDVHYVVVETAPGKTLVGLPKTTGLPNGWNLRLRDGRKIVLVKDLGLRLIIR
jgi:hypothetical protein